jgi:hypothetical protein
LDGLQVKFPQLVHTIAVITHRAVRSDDDGHQFLGGRERETPRAVRQLGSLEVDGAQRNCSI